MSIAKRFVARLAEVAGFEHSRVKAFMKKRGYRCLGEGLEGSVWSNGKNVLKIMLASKATPYLTFVKYALAHPNKHYPKFLGYRTDIPFGPTKLTSVKLELLKPIPVSDAAIAQELYSLAGYVANNGEPPEEDELNDIGASATYAKHKSLIEAIASLMEWVEGSSRMIFDEGSPGDNIMRRGSTWVVTDPYIGLV